MIKKSDRARFYQTVMAPFKPKKKHENNKTPLANIKAALIIQKDNFAENKST